MERKIVLVTGASRGIGHAIAKAFAIEGCDLILTCLNNYKLLKEYADELSREYNITCEAYQVDHANISDVDSLFDSIEEHFGHIDILVNNAGISYVGLLTDMDIEAWRDIMSTNLDSLFYTCRRAIPMMLQEHQGSIINISSIWGNVGASMEVAYSASKGGVNAFTKALAKELAPSHIAVNAIACGLIDTDMNNHLTKEELDDVIAEIPADRIGTPKEVAKVVVSVASLPSYLTGQIIGIDGAW